VTIKGRNLLTDPGLHLTGINAKRRVSEDTGVGFNVGEKETGKGRQPFCDIFILSTWSPSCVQTLWQELGVHTEGRPSLACGLTEETIRQVFEAITI
jgi:hypothetical protein